MSDYRNVDAIVKDKAVCITSANSSRPVPCSGIPEITEEVALDTDQGYSMIVEVTAVSDDAFAFKGRVTHGYFPKDENDWINVGERVEFARKKIAGVRKR